MSRDSIDRLKLKRALFLKDLDLEAQKERAIRSSYVRGMVRRSRREITMKCQNDKDQFFSCLVELEAAKKEINRLIDEISSSRSTCELTREGFLNLQSSVNKSFSLYCKESFKQLRTNLMEQINIMKTSEEDQMMADELMPKQNDQTTKKSQITRKKSDQP